MLFLKRFFSILLFSLTIVSGFQIPVEARTKVDYCGTKDEIGRLVPDTLGDFDFSKACRAHDICYADPAKTKSPCDTEFLNNMLEVCANTPFRFATLTGLNLRNYSYYQSCVSAAYTYYYAVDRYGIYHKPTQTVATRQNSNNQTSNSRSTQKPVQSTNKNSRSTQTQPTRTRNTPTKQETAKTVAKTTAAATPKRSFWFFSFR